MKRIFLGWHKPLLELTADFLVEHHTDTSGRLDLKNVTVVLPGTRACNRLEEILAKRAKESKNKAWYPPEFLTPELLPEQFYKRKKPIAGKMVRSFAWMEAIARLDPASRNLLLPKMPSSFEARLALGRLLDELHDELAAEGLDFDAVAKACPKNEIPRWNAMASLQKHYANDATDAPGYLDEHDLWDIQAARLYAIKKQDPQEREKIRAKLQQENRQFYLVGLVDMNKLQKDILKNFDDFITSLVFAPDDDAKIKERFDEFGCLRSDKWSDAPIEIDDDIVKIVLKPEHQADTVLREIDKLGDDYSTGEIIVGVQDKEVVPFLQQRFAQANLPARLVEGTPLKRTAVFRLLEVLLKFLKTNHFRDYAELVRHPDIEWLSKYNGVIRQLDVYHDTCFPVFVPEKWKTVSERHHENCESLQEHWEQIKQFLGISATQRHPFGDWLTKLKTMLDKLYKGHRNNQQINAALAIVSDKIDSMKTSLKGLPEQFSFAEALEVFVSHIESESIAPTEETGAIEMIGWLDTAMDDAPVTLITGMNDGMIPSFANADMFLPDELRKALGLTDNRRRAARDAYYLNVLLETRKNEGKVALIAGRRSTEGDPLLPSRFFFASDDVRKVSKRVQDFFKDIESEIPIRLASSLKPGRSDDRGFRAPKLPALEKTLEKISVTAVKDYKECAYRFYLKHCLGLKKVNDDATELGHDDFGILIHEILRRFGAKDSPVRKSKSANEIENFLTIMLDEYVREHYDDTLMSTVEIQIERARQRLKAFAQWQAKWRHDKYEIVDVEFKLDDPASPMIANVQLRGQIDRIDRKGDELFVLDYKTGDAGPQEKHYSEKRGWIDFQLPLYHHILKESGYAKNGDTIRLGYVTISKNLNNVREQMVDWDETVVDEGIAEAKCLIAKMVSQDWSTVVPKTPAPKYSKDFEFICHDDIS